MVLTEFNEEVYKKGIYEEGYSEGVNHGKSLGIAQGIVQGRSQGQSEIVEAIKRIHSGATVDDLIKAGFDKETAELAWSCR